MIRRAIASAAIAAALAIPAGAAELDLDAPENVTVQISCAQPGGPYHVPQDIHRSTAIADDARCIIRVRVQPEKTDLTTAIRALRILTGGTDD